MLQSAQLPFAAAHETSVGASILRFARVALSVASGAVARFAKARTDAFVSRQIAGLNAHLRRDIGLEPFDTYAGWQGKGRQDPGRLIA